MHCPICQKAGLADDALHCPQCNSDLSGLYRLRNINTANSSEKPVNSTDTPPKYANKMAPILLAAAALLFVSVVILFWRKPNEGNLYSAENRNSADINKEKDSLNAIIAAMKMENKSAKSEPKNGNKVEHNAQTTPYIYVAKKGDNLARIAHYFYGNASAYPQILKDNNLPDNYLLLVGDTLTLKLNR
jgi:uncharacterized membrane protein YvbJ